MPSPFQKRENDSGLSFFAVAVRLTLRSLVIQLKHKARFLAPIVCAVGYQKARKVGGRGELRQEKCLAKVILSNYWRGVMDGSHGKRRGVDLYA